MLSRRLLLGSVLLLILLGAVITVRKPRTKSEAERSEGALPGTEIADRSHHRKLESGRASPGGSSRPRK